MSITHPRSPDVDPLASGTVRSRAALTRLSGAGALGGFGQALAGSAAALLAARVAGDAWAGVPQTALVVGAGASAALIALLTPRLGRRQALAVGAGVAVVGALTIAAGAQLGSLILLLVGCLAVGAGNAAVMLGRYAAADLATPSWRGRAMATVLTATTVGAVAGPNLLAAADALGRRVGLAELAGPYVLAAATFIAATVVLARRDPESRLGRAREPMRRAVRPPWTARAQVGLVVLAAANLVMVSVMTMAPVHLHDGGMHLSMVGLVISLHILGMFAPSPVSGWLTDRFGPEPTAVAAGVVMATSCGAATMIPAVSGMWPGTAFALAMTGLGIGWNLALVAGSALLTADLAEEDRPRREGLGEVAMAAAAAGGGGAGGLLMAAAGYPWLAAAGVLLSLTIPAATLGRVARPTTRPGAS